MSSHAVETARFGLFGGLLILLAGLIVPGADAQTLALPEALIDLRSEQGQELLRQSDVATGFVPLSVNFVTQANPAFCGVASIVMVLNALQLPAPPVPEFGPYRTFTQENLLDERAEAILPRAVLEQRGMNLEQLAALAALHPVEAVAVHTAESSLDTFRNTALEYLGREGHFVLVNYLRKAIGQEEGGHISPLAAYDAESDRFLILDVSRYKYPPVWVTAAELFAAMNTRVSENRTRGYVLIKRAGSPSVNLPGS